MHVHPLRHAPSLQCTAPVARGSCSKQQALGVPAGGAPAAACSSKTWELHMATGSSARPSSSIVWSPSGFTSKSWDIAGTVCHQGGLVLLSAAMCSSQDSARAARSRAWLHQVLPADSWELHMVVESGA